MRNKAIFFLAGMIAAATLATRAQADGFKAMARDLAKEAKKAGISRVAVMPFEPADGSSARDGWNISEKLVTQLVRTGKVQALERSMLKALLDEHQLGRTGALDPATMRRLGRVLSAEGIVIGSFTTIGREVVVNARLINIETGVIIAASERRAARDWFDSPSISFRAPEFIAERFPLAAEGDSQYRDAVSDEGCVDAAARVDRMENEILDLKARYWALQLKNGVSLAGLKENPGATISDPELKQEFYDRMKSWYAQRQILALSPIETKRFIAVDGRAFSLAQRCGI